MGYEWDRVCNNDSVLTLGAGHEIVPKQSFSNKYRIWQSTRDMYKMVLAVDSNMYNDVNYVHEDAIKKESALFR